MSNQEELMTADNNHARIMGEAYNRLKKNPDYKLVVGDGYLKEKALASVSCLAVPSLKAEGRRPDIMEDLVAIANFRFYLGMIENQYEGTVNPILSDEEESELEG